MDEPLRFVILSEVRSSERRSYAAEGSLPRHDCPKSVEATASTSRKSLGWMQGSTTSRDASTPEARLSDDPHPLSMTEGKVRQITRAFPTLSTG